MWLSEGRGEQDRGRGLKGTNHYAHEPRSEPSTPVCPGDKPPHMTLERALGSIGKNPCRRKWQLNPIFFFLESPMDSGAWWATAQEVPKISDTT